MASLPDKQRALIWSDTKRRSRDVEGRTFCGPCDPWHLISRATEVIVDADDELALIAAIAGKRVRCIGEGEFGALSADAPSAPDLPQFFRHFLVKKSYFDPFDHEPVTLERVVEMSSFWRRLIDSNRDLTGAVGFAFWKRPTVAPLLWNGSTKVAFLGSPRVGPGDKVAVWKSRTSAKVLDRLTRQNAHLVEVEDGFIRSAGLGAECVPPLSIVVDRLGIYFDPDQPSDLERLLQDGDFTADLIDRAIQLREVIVDSGLSKYGKGSGILQRRSDKRHVLVPGQVEDDRSVQCGGGVVRTNLELLRRARQAAPDAYIIYKPHPDVEAGHRIGAVSDDDCLKLADEKVRNAPISALLDLVDEVHVNTSLAGFEALLRGKPVTTHGVPFYAGWGLTHDLGPVPSRRTASRTIDELVAAVLLVYPRYLDPETHLPCPPEILIRRLSEQSSRPQTGPLVTLRRLHGRLRRALTAVRPV